MQWSIFINHSITNSPLTPVFSLHWNSLRWCINSEAIPISLRYVSFRVIEITGFSSAGVAVLTFVPQDSYWNSWRALTCHGQNGVQVSHRTWSSRFYLDPFAFWLLSCYRTTDQISKFLVWAWLWSILDIDIVLHTIEGLSLSYDPANCQLKLKNLSSSSVINIHSHYYQDHIHALSNLSIIHPLEHSTTCASR